MDTDPLLQKCEAILRTLCADIPDRSVGSPGNQAATRFFHDSACSLGWEAEVQEFDALDWIDGGASLQAGGEAFEVLVSPYSLGFEGTGEWTAVSSLAELEQTRLAGKIVLLHGEIAREQLMPKNFVFYNPEEHQRIVAQLEKSQPRAIIAATGRNPALSGGVYPFPLIEDGDFDIPSVYMTEEEGARLLRLAGQPVTIRSNSTRVPSKGYNVIARKGRRPEQRIVVSAHIDAKKGIPGAIDNASGVAVLLLLAELLGGYQGDRQVELAAFNGEDYYAASGQMLYLRQNEGRFDQVMFNINIDGAGYREGPSAFSFYNLPEDLDRQARDLLREQTGIVEGQQWYQSDHSMFLQQGRPAIAVTSSWFSENMSDQQITHTPKDNLEIVDCGKLVEIARALNRLVSE